MPFSAATLRASGLAFHAALAHGLEIGRGGGVLRGLGARLGALVVRRGRLVGGDAELAARRFGARGRGRGLLKLRRRVGGNGEGGVGGLLRRIDRTFGGGGGHGDARAPTCGKALAVLENRGDGLPDGHGAARLQLDAPEGARAGRFEFEGGLVRLDRADHLTGLHLVPVPFKPFEERALLHSVAHLGHDHFGHKSLGPLDGRGTRLPPAVFQGALREEASNSRRLIVGCGTRAPRFRFAPYGAGEGILRRRRRVGTRARRRMQTPVADATRHALEGPRSFGA